MPGPSATAEAPNASTTQTINKGVTAINILEIELFFTETSLRSESSCVVSGIWRIGSKVGCLANGWELERAESSQWPAPKSDELARRGFAYFFIATTGKVCIVLASRTSPTPCASAGSKMKTSSNSANLSE